MSERITVPKIECGDCRFFAVGEDPVGFCHLYDKHWHIDDDNEAEMELWHDNNATKPGFCKATTAVILENHEQSFGGSQS